MDYWSLLLWKFHIWFVIIQNIQKVSSQISVLNSPPVPYVDRNWDISEYEEIGSMITRARAVDADNDVIEYGLEPLYRGSYLNNEEENSSEKLPFSINSRTGIVYLNNSLLGRGGESFPLYVTASDGHVTAKTEVYVTILEGNSTNINNSGKLSLAHQVKNISNFFPPFKELPGVQQIQNQKPQRPSKNPYNNYENDDKRLIMNNEMIIPKFPELFDNNSLGTRTKLIAIGNDNRTQFSNYNNSLKLNTNKTVNDIYNLSAININQTEKKQEQYTIISLIPVIITICSVFLIALLIAIFIYRRHLCILGNSIKKKSKEEMTKKSNQSNISSNITDDSRNSMVLHNWNGPTAFSNRYVPWERENQEPSMAISQLSTSSFNEMKKDRWEFPRHRLKFFNILGEGAFGQVWRCEAVDIDGTEGLTTVAVKTLKENATEIERNDLNSELKVMKSLEPHVNVVRLLGCCSEKEPILVIIEYVNRGKLQTYLRKSRAERHYGNTHGKSDILTSGDLTSFMYQVARGMDYLTSRGIIHRDLAARNILITDDHICKVADFGFARDVIASKIYERKSEGKLPIRWMAIESLYDNIFSVKSDIWSFGILMWEIVTLGSTPYPGVSAADVMKKVRDGYRLEKPEHCRRELYNIMYYCWAKDPNERPSFLELVQLLDKLLSTETDYIELERFPDHNYYNMLSLSGEKL